MNTNQIKEQIVTRIAAASEEVSAAVVSELATAEINRRTSMITASVKFIGKMEQKLAELEVGDVVTYNKAGDKEAKYSETVFNQIKDLKEKIAKAYEASDMALKENNEEAYKNLAEVMTSTERHFSVIFNYRS